MFSCVLLAVVCTSFSVQVDSLGAQANIPSSELNTLHDFYNSTNGPGWDWTSSDDDYYPVLTGNPWNFTTADPNPCADDWIGVTCSDDAVDGYLHVVGLSLPDSNLVGTLPESISELKCLETLDLDRNQLFSSIPSTMWSLSNMTHLDLSYNRLTGSLPRRIDSLAQLDYFSVGLNSLHGSIPDSFYNLTSLSYVNLLMNQFTGTISSLITNLDRLKTLNLMYNQFDGELPSELLCITSLEGVFVGTSFFSGPLPDCGVVLHNLTQFAIIGCQFDGTIPSSYGLFPAVLSLYLSGNRLTGPIPDSFGNLTTLQLLAVDNNHLSGTVPESLMRVNITTLTLTHNHFSGTIPEVLWDNEFLQEVFFSVNLFSGTLSNSIGNPANPYPDIFKHTRIITTLDISNNILTGTLPRCLGDLRIMQGLFLNNNRFTGSLEGIFNATTNILLVNIDVSTNQLTGTLPEEVFRIKHLLSFAAGSNCFHGSLPSNICSAYKMRTIALDGLMSANSCQNRFFPHWTHINSYWTSRQIEGSIPPCLLNAMPLLFTLHLSGNGYRGTIPDLDYIGENLTDLSLSNNLLKGVIPNSIQEKVWTARLDLSYNQLSGVLSGGFPSYGLNASLYLDVNRLSGAIPSSLKDTEHISILDSNLFSCSVSRSSLPSHDPNHDKYECGSNSLNAVLYIWLGVGVLLLLGVVATWSWSRMAFNHGKMLIMKYVDACNGGHLTDFSTFLSNLRSCVNLLTVIIFVTMMIVNTVLSTHFNTYTHEYAWNISSVFLSGWLPAVVLLLAFGGLSLIEWTLFVKYLRSSHEDRIIQPGGQSKAWSVTQWFALIMIVLGNVVLMVSVNIGYVYVNKNASNAAVQVTQLAVAVFKVCWNGFIVRFVLRLTSRFNDQSSSRRGSLLTALSIILFNNLAAPFLAIALISSSCFYDVITTPATVDTSYSYYYCYSYTSSGDDDIQDYCSDYQLAPNIRSTSYIPPFHYGYQCSSTYISVYSSIYVIMLIISTFVTPLLQVTMAFLEKSTEKDGWLSRMLNEMLPKLLRVSNSLPRNSLMGSFLAGGSVFDCEMFIVQLINIVAVMLTFGVVFPPIALFCCAAVFSMSWFTQLCIGRYIVLNGDNGLCEKLLGNSPSFDSEVSQARVLFLNSLWIVVPYCTVFYSFLLFDTLGDAEGWMVAVSMPIVVFLISAGSTVTSFLCSCVGRVKDSGNHSRAVSEDISSGLRLTSELDNN